MGSFERLKERKVFRDAVHGYIWVDYQVIWDLINSSPMQRLRRISQLGGSKMVFPTAEHSRFSHVLGAYEIARQIIEKVEDIQTQLSEFDHLTLLCAALLHDCGHGPFSHAFELLHPISHETYSIRFILEDTVIHQILCEAHENLPEAVAQAIQGTHPIPAINQLISSQLDVDRLDYLMRDSYFTGTTYGEIDRERIVRLMHLHEGRVVYKSSGISALEDYIMGRYHMYQQVYYHPSAMSYEILMSLLFKRLRDLHQQHSPLLRNYESLIPFFSDQLVPLEVYVRMDESVMLALINEMQEELDPILVDLSKRLLNRNLFKYKSIHSEEELKALYDQVTRKGLNPDYYFYVVQPRPPVYQATGEGTIQLLHDQGEVHELSVDSEIVHTVRSDGKQKESAKIVFFPK